MSERLQACNERLQNSSRAHLAVARRQVCAEIKKLKLHAWLRLRKRRGQRQLYLIEDEAARVAQSQLDGCYVIRTDLPTAAALAFTPKKAVLSRMGSCQAPAKQSTLNGCSNSI